MTTSLRTTVAVIDDHHLFRAGLIELINSMPDIDVVAEGATSTDAITHARTLHPDIVLLDVELPDPGPAATIGHITEADPQTHVIVLTMHDDPTLVHELVTAGASGYLLKTAGRWELLAAITAARRNEDIVVVSVSRTTLLALAATTRSATGALSRREVDIMRQLAHGGTNLDNATALNLREATVKRHLANIFAKLGATSRIDALLKAQHNGILHNDAR